LFLEDVRRRPRAGDSAQESIEELLEPAGEPGIDPLRDPGLTSIRTPSSRPCRSRVRPRTRAGFV